MSFLDHFVPISRRKVGGGQKTAAADQTSWRGSGPWAGVELRITPRTIVAGEAFLTSANHRLRGSHVGAGGYFLDVEVTLGYGGLGQAQAARLARLVAALDADRPVRVRRAGARFREALFVPVTGLVRQAGALPCAPECLCVVGAMRALVGAVGFDAVATCERSHVP